MTATPQGSLCAALRERWPLSGHLDVRDSLLSAYGDPRRGYHDLQHLADVLDHLEQLRRAGVRFTSPVVELAAWFHDGVYDGQPGAEERSAQWALTSLTLPEAQNAEVARLVRLTEEHCPHTDDLDGQALCDADLAILAAPAERYREYTSAVRREYAHVDEHAYRQGRSMVLQALLDKPRLFETEAGFALWESRARHQVGAEIRRLTQPAVD